MKLNKKVVESVTVTSAMFVMTTITAFGSSTEESISRKIERAALNKNGTAGVIHELYNEDTGILSENNILTAEIEKTEKEIVGKSSEDSLDTISGVAEIGEFAAEAVTNIEFSDVPVETADEQEVSADAEELPQEAQEWEKRVMANVEEDMNIRTAPDENSEVAGKFYRGDVAEVVSTDDGWTQIVSGNVSGYVKNDYLVYGMEANELANEVCSLYATVNTDGLRLRSEPNEEAEIVTTANTGDRLKVDKDVETDENWIAVHTSDATAYVSAEYVGVELNLGTALNSEEVAAKEAKEAEAKAAEEGKKPAVAASTDEVTLLGALIQCEAGSGSYEGMVAVGAVVMNRVRSGGYPGSISGVIYQGGQFPPALNGSVANVMANGVRSACLQAAQEAIGGRDNTNGALSFRSAASGASGTVIGANVFF